MINTWPRLDYLEWRDTCSALQLYLQVAGKYRLAHTPWVNHSWHATFYVTPRGLTSSLIPDGAGIEILFDFHDHRIVGTSGDGRIASFALRPMTVAKFYGDFINLSPSWAAHRASISNLMKSLTQCRSTRMISTVPTSTMLCSVFITRCWRSTGCSRHSGHLFLEKAVRSTSSGAASTSPSLVFPDAARHFTAEEFQHCPTMWRKKLMIGKLRRPAFGQAEAAWITLLSMPMLIRHRTDFDLPRSSPTRLSGTKNCRSSFCPTRPSRCRKMAMPHFCRSSNRPMKPQPILDAGTAICWNVVPGDQRLCGHPMLYQCRKNRHYPMNMLSAKTAPPKGATICSSMA